MRSCDERNRRHRACRGDPDRQRPVLAGLRNGDRPFASRFSVPSWPPAGVCASAAQQPMNDHSKMAGHNMDHGMQMNEAGIYLMNMASGTSANPQSWPMPMLASRSGSWDLMFMSQAFLIDTQQSGPSGGDKLYSSNWFMGSAGHAVGKGSLMFQAMLSLDPATITDRRYPLLFQTGETAYGKPLTDAQHPHDFVMNIGVHYARPVGGATMLQLYYAPVGDPALGP